MSHLNVMKSFAVVALLLALGACEKRGPLERFGEEVDEAIEDVSAGGETTGNKIDDAIDEAQDAAEDVLEELE